MKKKLLIVLLVVLVLAMSLFLVACNKDGKDNGGNGGSTNNGGGSKPSVETYTVTFDSDGGSQVQSLPVQKDCVIDKILVPKNPTKAGYNFVGWYNGEDKWDFATDKVTQNITLKAKWEAKSGEDIVEEFTVTFDSDGGTAVKNEIVTDGEYAIGPYKDPKKDGYIFIGWFLGDNEFDFETTKIESDITLVAKWQVKYPYLYFSLSEDETSYIVSFNMFGGEGIDEIVIPREYMLKPVTMIDYMGFSEADNVTSIVIPNSITTIDMSAFEGAKKLEKVTFEAGSKITTIAEETFSDCEKLTEINIPSSVTTIEYNAFSSCTSLENITLPSGLTTLGESAFANCSALTSIVIPNGITKIEDNTFCWCEVLTSVTFSAGLKEIGAEAFYNCETLTEIVLPNTLEKIGDDAFGYCGLTRVVIPKSVTVMGSGVFYFCSNLTQINLAFSESWYETLMSATWDSNWYEEFFVELIFDYGQE